MRCLCSAELCVFVGRMRWNRFIVWSSEVYDRGVYCRICCFRYSLRVCLSLPVIDMCVRHTAETADCCFVRQSCTDRGAWCTECVRMRRACVFPSCGSIQIQFSRFFFFKFYLIISCSAPKAQSALKSVCLSVVMQVVAGEWSQIQKEKYHDLNEPLTQKKWPLALK